MTVVHLVEGSGEEGGEGGGEDHGSVATGGSRRHTHQVLFRDEALDVSKPKRNTSTYF